MDNNRVIYTVPYDSEVEYLESTGTQVIKTGINIRSGYFEAKVTHIGNEGEGKLYPCLFGKMDNTEGSGNYSLNRFLLYRDNPRDHYCLEYGYGDNIYQELPPKTFIYPKTEWKVTSQYEYYDREVEIFSVNGGDSSNMRFYYLRLWDSSNKLLRDFIPVRVGQIGYLYDKVSKQLFGNKGTGNFILGSDVPNAIMQQRCVLYFGNQRSVGFERIYEEYEWLKGDGKAYIDTLIKDFTGVTDLSVSAKKINNSSGSIMGCEGPNNTNRFIYNLAYTSNKNRLISFIGTVINPTYDNKKAYKINVNFVENFEKINGSKRTYSTIPAILYRTLPLFATKELNGTVKNISSDIYIEYFRVDNSMHLVPCKLLQSIPAILDGNGIARQAGECGMWDKVSNQFYGNINSIEGSFTVENNE